MQVSHDDKGVTSVSFVEGVDVRRPGRVSDLLARAMRQRAVGATASNEHSSRSHMVFTLTISASNASSGQQVTGKPSVNSVIPLFADTLSSLLVSQTAMLPQATHLMTSCIILIQLATEAAFKSFKP